MDIEKDIAVEKDYEKTLKELLKKVKRGNIDVDSVLLQLNDIVKKEELKAILENHHYRIYEGEAKSNGKIYKRWFTYVNEGGKKRQIKRKTKEEVEEYLYDFYTNAETNQSDVITFEIYYHKNWIVNKKKEKLSDNTIYRYETDYKRFFKGTDFEKMRLTDIRGVDILEFVARKTEELSLSSRAFKSLIYYIKDVFEYVVDERIINESPISFIRKKLRQIEKSCTTEVIKNDKDRTISKEDLIKLLDKIRDDYIKKPEYITVYAIEFAIITGCRVGEIAALRWSDIENNVITVRSSEKAHRVKGKPTLYEIEGTKTNTERHIPVAAELMDLLHRVEIAENQLDCKGEFVFSDKSGRIKAQNISNCMRKKCIQAGIKQKSIHACRRTFNSVFKSVGGNTTMASALLGHTQEVNEKCYTYDVNDMETKKDYIERTIQSLIS